MPGLGSTSELPDRAQEAEDVSCRAHSTASPNHPPTGSRTITLDRHACVHRVLPSRQLVRHIRTGKLSASPWPRGSRAPYAHRVATARELAGLTVVRRLLHLGGDGVSALRNLRADQAPGLLGGRRAASQLGEGPALSEARPERRLVLYKGSLRSAGRRPRSPTTWSPPSSQEFPPSPPKINSTSQKINEHKQTLP